MTKKTSNIYSEMARAENISRALRTSVINKSKYAEVQSYRKNPAKYEDDLLRIIVRKKYKVKEPRIISKVTDNGKVRVIPLIPLFYDQALQHCLLAQSWEKHWVKGLTDDTYNCIKQRGINSKVPKWNMCRKLKRAILEMSKRGEVYYGKCDIKKHYPSVRHSVFRKAYRHVCKDKDALNLFDELNYAVKGLPIGWPTGAPSSHLILNRLDHYAKEVLHIKYYFRYADDIVFLSLDKPQLHEWMWRIRNYLWYELKQQMKGNYKVAPLSEGIDFGGYVFYKDHTMLRKRIKKNLIKKRHNKKSLISYMGIVKFCDSRNLINKVIKLDNCHMSRLEDLGITIDKRFWGKKITIDNLEGEPITILDFDVRNSTKEVGKLWMRMQVLYNGKKRFVKTSAQDLANFMSKVDRKYLPLEEAVILKDEGGSYYFKGTIKE